MHSLQIQAILKELHVLAKKHASQQTLSLHAQHAISPSGVVVMCCTQQKSLLFVSLTLKDCPQSFMWEHSVWCNALHTIQAVPNAATT